MNDIEERSTEISKRKTGLQRALYRFFHSPLSVIGLLIILFIAAVAVFAPYLAPYPGDAGDAINFGRSFKPPSAEHPFGTDEVGRDIFSRVIFGSRLSLKVGGVVLFIAITVGIPLGLIAAYMGGITETIIMRLADVFLSIPPLVLALAVAAVFKPSLTNSMIAISFTWWPWYVRLAYGEGLSIKEEDFVEVSESVGASKFHVMFREILPNMASALLVKGTLDMGYAILMGASLGFLGVGAQPPTPAWGTMISLGRRHLSQAWWLATFPGIAIFLTVLGFNLLGDGLRDFFDVEVER
ncbi:MAG: ABC transporter permease [Candidatus Bipolaricaulota bacterium]